ncbi:hypothetical protein [Geobacter sp. SVR]|uniref:hypothetical protein n=1 Tax=Geobacter sp. SVR TaxID=2495594 RepID=UPI00143EF55F|nr:hypothetical protein [Geobacter sp. SVR]BCS54428.1 hypothetical protein GSVR_27360 [Geobacter sp. SVR]GCF87660.1 hypothetical protein GSbR_42600 [Geobacter sp. SVR]
MLSRTRKLLPDYKTNPSSLLLLITWTAGASIAIILTLYGLTIHRTISDEIIRDAKEASVKVCNALFEDQKNELITPGTEGEAKLRLAPDAFRRVDRHYRRFLSNFEILKIKIYDSQNTIIYSTDAKIIGRGDSGNKLLNRALRGEVHSKLVKKEKMLDLSDEARFNVEVVETYVPIKVGNRVIGAFETYTDVVSSYEQISRIVLTSVLSLTVILLLVFGLSYLIIKKAVVLLKTAQQELAVKVVQLETALSEVKNLQGIIPICMHCKKIRDDKESWHQLEQYISQHTEAHFSHGICPECFAAEMQTIKKRKSLDTADRTDTTAPSPGMS